MFKISSSEDTINMANENIFYKYCIKISSPYFKTVVQVYPLDFPRFYKMWILNKKYPTVPSISQQTRRRTFTSAPQLKCLNSLSKTSHRVSLYLLLMFFLFSSSVSSSTEKRAHFTSKRNGIPFHPVLTAVVFSAILFPFSFYGGYLERLIMELN